MENTLAYFLIGLPISFGVGYIIGVMKSDRPINKEEQTRATYFKRNEVDCIGYRGGHKCDRKTSKYSINGLCNRCDDARFGY